MFTKGHILFHGASFAYDTPPTTSFVYLAKSYALIDLHEDFCELANLLSLCCHRNLHNLPRLY